MRSKTIAIAAIWLAASAGAASAQRNDSQTVPSRATQATPAGPDAATVPLKNTDLVQNPKVNPNAAGTVMSWEKPDRDALKESERYGGSRQVTPNTHPLSSMKARKQMQPRGNATNNGSQPPPRPTLDADAGR